MKTIKYLSGFGLLTIALMSCGGGNTSTTASSSTNQPTIEQLTNNKDAAKQQLFLRLVSETETDSSKIYIAKSLYEKDTVGLQVEVLKNIKPGINAEGRPVEDGFVKGTIKLSSIGAQSDAFVKALGTIFKVENSGKMDTAVLLPTVFSSNKGDVDLSKQATYSFKLFLDNAKGEPAEVFANVDTYRKSFELSEKDATYRAQLVSAFEAK